MKKLWLLILWLCTTLFACNFTLANSEYEYTNLDITADILEDWTMNVKEDFTANFSVKKHGIIRTIPLNYTVSGYGFHIDVSDINVSWKTFTTSKSNWEIEIRIWDANRTVFWEQKYPISYTTYWLIRNFSWMGYAELYWNLVWYDFDTSINNVSAVINLPKSYTWFTADDFLITIDWSTKTIEKFKWTVDWSHWDKIIITYNKWLSAFQWITLAIKFPNDYFKFDHERQAKLIGQTGLTQQTKLTKQAKNNKWISNFLAIVSTIAYTMIAIFATLIVISFLFLSIYIFLSIKKKLRNIIDRHSGWLRWKFAREFPVIIQYDPPKWLNSAEVWFLLHREARAKDMLSLVYKRAAEWLINLSIEKDKILFFKTTYVVITKKKDIDEKAPKYEQKLFKSLVRKGRNKIDRTTNLYSRLKMSDLDSYGKSRGWVSDKSDSNLFIKFVRIVLFVMLVLLLIKYWRRIIGCIIFILSFFVLSFLLRVLFPESKAKETEKWAKLISHILWYRKFLAACDENKFRLFLQQDPLYFDKVLPYAIVFGLDTKLIKKMEHLMEEMNIKSSLYDWDFNSINIMNDTISSSAIFSAPESTSSSGSSSYSSSSWFSSWSSFSSWWWGWWFSSWWWGWWWGWRSW